MKKWVILCTLVALSGWLSITFANDTDLSVEELADLPLEELLEIKIVSATSAARKSQKLTETAAALYVITQEDIRHAGITSLPEALRLAPGINVSRLDASKWAINARGLNERFPGKLLVMIDGRTVYTTLQSEIRWDEQDLLIEDIDRIEVIRGPGASLWGANAVNGVINIITKPAGETQGNLITYYHGSGEEKNITGWRHGGKINKSASYRVYGKVFQYNSLTDEQNNEHHDNWQVNRGGGRVDWESGKNDLFSAATEAYDGYTKQIWSVSDTTPNYSQMTDLSGFHVLTRWKHNLSHGETVLQAYYDLSDRSSMFLKEHRGNYDVDFQHRVELSKQEIIWGLGFRHTYDDLKGTPYQYYIPERRRDNLWSLFIQDEFRIGLPKRLAVGEKGHSVRLTLGTKLEHNNYTGLEIQPTARLLLTPDDRNEFWAAISKAVHTPSRNDVDLHLDILSPDSQFKITGNPESQSEQLHAYELGYRFLPSKHFLLDISLFYNDYLHLFTNEIKRFVPYPLLIELGVENKMHGTAYGAELALNWQVNPAFNLKFNYNFLQIQLKTDADSTDTNATSLAGNTPHNSATLRALWNIRRELELDTAIYYSGRLDTPDVPSHARLDLRLGWRPSKKLEISVGARNLFDNNHIEFRPSDTSVLPSQIQPATYLQLKYRF